MSESWTPRYSHSLYKFLQVFLYALYRSFFRFEFHGSDQVPDESDKRGVILAPNHASFLDPPILGISLKRHITYLAKEYLFKAFLVGWTLRNIGALPVKSESGADFRSLRQLLRILKEGSCAVVFPEGTRTQDGEFRTPESGVGFLAAKSKAWVVPVYIDGTFAAFPRGAKIFKCHRVKVFYGKPFVPAEDSALMAREDVYQAISERIMTELKDLKKNIHPG